MADTNHFRKKPVVIQAIQWDGTLSGMDSILSSFNDIRTVAKTSHPPTNTCSFWKIGTLEGGHEVSAGDFIIRGVKGEYYPCKPDIFSMTYEPATDTPPADAALADEWNIEYLLATAVMYMRDVGMPNEADAIIELQRRAAALRARSDVPTINEYIAAANERTDELISVARSLGVEGDVNREKIDAAIAALRARAVPDMQLIRQAVARGWCHPLTSGMVMDASLAEAISAEIYAMLAASKEAP